jgi:hypothetical protein
MLILRVDFQFARAPESGAAHQVFLMRASQTHDIFNVGPGCYMEDRHASISRVSFPVKLYVIPMGRLESLDRFHFPPPFFPVIYA